MHGDYLHYHSVNMLYKTITLGLLACRKNFVDVKVFTDLLHEFTRKFCSAIC